MHTQAAAQLRRSLRAQRLPDGRVALEAGAEGDLPHAIAAPDAAGPAVGREGAVFALGSAHVSVLSDQFELVPGGEWAVWSERGGAGDGAARGREAGASEAGRTRSRRRRRFRNGRGRAATARGSVTGAIGSSRWRR